MTNELHVRLLARTAKAYEAFRQAVQATGRRRLIIGDQRTEIPKLTDAVGVAGAEKRAAPAHGGH